MEKESEKRRPIWDEYTILEKNKMALRSSATTASRVLLALAVAGEQPFSW
jgi:hypothetical protein